MKDKLGTTKELNDYIDKHSGKGCKYGMGLCERCDNPKCVYDCKSIREFISPILHEFIWMAYEKRPNIHLVAAAFRVTKRAIRKVIKENTKKGNG